MSGSCDRMFFVTVWLWKKRFCSYAVFDRSLNTVNGRITNRAFGSAPVMSAVTADIFLLFAAQPQNLFRKV